MSGVHLCKRTLKSTMITDYLCHHCFQRLTCCKSGCFMYLPFTVREWCRPNSWQRQVRRKQWLDYPAVKKKISMIWHMSSCF